MQFQPAIKTTHATSSLALKQSANITTSNWASQQILV